MEPEIADMCGHLETCKETWDYVRLLYSNYLTCIYDVSKYFSS